MKLFAEVRAGAMLLNRVGSIVQDEWFRTRVVRPQVRLWEEEFVVMPDHVHGILWMADSATVAPTMLGSIIGQFKSVATRRINAALATPGMHRWQRGYYEHVIRNEDDLGRIREYIRDNPRRWGLRHGYQYSGPDSGVDLT